MDSGSQRGSLQLLHSVKVPPSESILFHDHFLRHPWLDIGFIDHFTTLLVTTRDYNAIPNLRSLHITTAHAKPFQSAFTSRFPVTDLNNGDSSAFVLTSLLSGEYPTQLNPFSI
jgi:hypothetical protein